MFITYLQRHRAVLPAIARLSCFTWAATPKFVLCSQNFFVPQNCEWLGAWSDICYRELSALDRSALGTISVHAKVRYFVGAFRSKNMDKNGANAWGKNEDGTVNTSGPRVVVGDGNMGPQGGFITKWVMRTDRLSLLSLFSITGQITVCCQPGDSTNLQKGSALLTVVLCQSLYWCLLLRYHRCILMKFDWKVLILARSYVLYDVQDGVRYQLILTIHSILTQKKQKIMFKKHKKTSAPSPNPIVAFNPSDLLTEGL